MSLQILAHAGSHSIGEKRVKETQFMTLISRFRLKSVEDILVMTADQHLEKEYPSWRVQVDPLVFEVLLRGADKNDKLALFVLFDEQLANRLAKAIVHAVELCGGGQKTEPF